MHSASTSPELIHHDDQTAALRAVSLDGAWTLRYGPQTNDAPADPAGLASSTFQTVPATVPGNVELDLIAAGRLPELHIGNNIELAREFETYRWFYQRSFITPEHTAADRVELVFGGIDCIATVFVNGQRAGAAQNMLIPHRFDVTALLRPAGQENELVVRIDSAVLEGRTYHPTPLEASLAANWESLHIRKAAHMYGWDIMPRLVSAGLWRSVRLEVVPPTRIVDVFFDTERLDAASKSANLLVVWDFATDRLRIDDLTVRISLLDASDKSCVTLNRPVFSTHGDVHFRLDDAQLWWPRGYGEQPLYTLRVELIDPASGMVDRCEKRIGIRTIHLRRTDLTTVEKPGEFTFVVNGKAIYAQGTNWVPLDALHSRDPQHLAGTMEMVLDLHCNMIRCWGGNVYEDHAFFDLCDQHGILVWQDFALACAIYPQDDELAEQMRVEGRSIIRRLRHHPSIALWAGNNENDESCLWHRPSLDPNFDRLSRQVLAAAVQSLDPLRPYLPSSPYHSPAFVAAGRDHRQKPEDHLWGPRDDYKQPYYSQARCHFVSEIGYHGCPHKSSLAKMMDADHLWPWQDNDQWLTHAVRPMPRCEDYNYRIPLMAKQIALIFGEVPEQIDDYVLASQVSQAEALKFFIELWRTSQPRTGGMLWWNIRDGWPIISDAVVDYFGARKLAYNCIKRSQADLCITLGEPVKGMHAIWMLSHRPVEQRLAITIRDIDGGMLHRCEVPAVAGENRTLGKIPAATKAAMWKLEWSLNGQPAGVNHYLAGPRPFPFGRFREWLKELELPT